MKMLNAPDVISGKEGRAFAKISGTNEELFYAKSVEAKVEKQKSEVTAIGKRMKGHKVTGMSGSGSMTMYYLSPVFRAVIADFKKTGADAYFDMVVENEDPSSAAGRQVVLLRNCNLDSQLLTKLDGGSDDALEEEMDFTFEDFDILTSFNGI